MAETTNTAPVSTTQALTSKFDIKPTDTVLTDSERIASILIEEGAKPKAYNIEKIFNDDCDIES